MFNLKHISKLISEQKCRFLSNFHKGNEPFDLAASYAIKDMVIIRWL